MYQVLKSSVSSANDQKLEFILEEPKTFLHFNYFQLAQSFNNLQATLLGKQNIWPVVITCNFS